MIQNEGEAPPRALLIGMQTREIDAQECALSLSELKELVGNLGIETAAAVNVKVRELSARFALGTGKTAELIAQAVQLGCEFIIFDQPLTPAQQRNWEAASKLSVADRHEVILDIFAQRAHTKEAALQVELAKLEYELPRLKRAWTHLSRQRGGGVTQRGEGETQLQIDQRLLRARIHRLREELADVVRQRAVQRQKRSRVPLPSAAIVGYTNAGKSSLLNRLTDAGVLAADKLFATLDPTTRQLALPDGRTLLLTDTVGFIRRLPHRLVDAFRATLEETAGADLLLHVVDSAGSERDAQIAAVEAVLAEIGGADVPTLQVFNKTDLLDNPAPRIDRDENGLPIRVWVSAATGAGIDLLMAAIAERLAGGAFTRATLRLPPAIAGRLRARLHALGAVEGETFTDTGEIELELSIATAELDALLAAERLDPAEVLVRRAALLAAPGPGSYNHAAPSGASSIRTDGVIDGLE